MAEYPGYDPDEPQEYPGYEPKLAKDYPAEEMVTDVPEITPTEEVVKEEPVGGVIAKIGIPYKSIIGFFTVFLGQLLARATVNDIPVLPEDLNGWLSLIGGSFVAAAVIYFKANVYTTPQVEDKARVAEKKHI